MDRIRLRGQCQGVESGAGRGIVFEATAAATPPLYLPATPTEGQSWEVAGTTVTIAATLTAVVLSALPELFGQSPPPPPHLSA